MAYLPYKESRPSVNSSLNIFNAENIDFSVKPEHFEQFYPQQTLFENIHFQIYSNEDYFIDLTSIFIDLKAIVKKFNNDKPSAADGLSYEKCILYILF
jgi:hypothetical protein